MREPDPRCTARRRTTHGLGHQVRGPKPEVSPPRLEGSRPRHQVPNSQPDVSPPRLEVSNVILEEDRDGRFADAPFGNADDEIVERVLVRVDCDAVHFEKRERRTKSRPFVAVEEGVIPADAVEIRRGHRKDRLVEKYSAEGGLDASHSRLQESEIADAGRPTKAPDLLRMEAEHLVESEELRAHDRLLAEPSEKAGIFRIDLVHGLA